MGPAPLVGALLLATGCPDDLVATSDGGDTGTTWTAPTGVDPDSGGGGSTGGPDPTTTGGADATGGADTTGGGTGPDPLTSDCSLEYRTISGVELAFYDTFTVDATSLCADITSLDESVPTGSYPIHVYRPQVIGTTDWPVDGDYRRPWIMLQHGNGQDALDYVNIISPLVEQGFVVFSADHGGVATPEWRNRADQISCNLRWVNEVYSERAELGSCFGLIGHSSGGAGALVAGIERGLSQTDPVGAVVAIAPGTPPGENDLTNLYAEANFPLLVLLGSRDPQTGIRGIESYDLISAEEGLDQALPTPGSSQFATGEKAFVWPYDVSHNAFGGAIAGAANDPFNEANLDVMEMTEKGRAVAAAYVPAFFFWQFFGGGEADNPYRPRFVDDEIPPSLEVAAWWDYLVQSEGEPLVTTAYQAGDRRGIGVNRFVIDTFEEDAPGDSYRGEGDRAVSAGVEDTIDVKMSLYDILLPASTYNRAARLRWQDTGNNPEGTIDWVFSLPTSLTPTHLSFRVENVFEDWETAAPVCQAVSTEVPLSFDVAIRSGGNGGPGLARTRVEDLIVQDHEAISSSACSVRRAMQTVNIPLACLTPDETANPLDLDSINAVQFLFGDQDTSQSGDIIIDSVALTYSPEEASVPECAAFLGTPPHHSFECVAYRPADAVSFDRDPSPAPGEPLGTITVDGGFADHVASRPTMVTLCDDARYEMQTVSVDSDSDGILDASHDVRALSSVDSSDLVFQVGLEEDDAAITINEPGKPADNGVELYGYSSFVEAFRRFGALGRLEVRLLREGTSGLHEPVLLDAEVPSAVRPPERPFAPSGYGLPSGATYVSNSADLVAELALPNGHDIIVSDGDYTWAGPVTVAGPHRVWADTLHGATIHFGLTYAGNADRTDGLELHGLDFQLDNASMAPAGVGSTHILFTWGQGGEDVLVEDCAFDGDLVVGDAIGAFAPSGLVVRRSTISNFWSHGIVAKQGGLGTVLGSEPLFEDLQIQSIFGANPGASNGARENGILLGNNGTIRRVDIRDVGWSAIQLYNDATGVSIQDVFLDYAGPDVWSTAYTSARGAGIWLSQSHDVTIERVRIESHVFLGINAHWDAGNPNPFANTTPPRNHNITISDLYSRAFKIGVHLDLGVEDVVVRSARFEHAWMAGVLDNNRFEDDWNWHPCPGGEEVCLESLNRTESIDCYLQDGVDCVAHHHNGGATATPPASWPANADDYLQPGGPWNRNNAALPGPGAGGGSSGGQADSSTSS